MKGYKFKNILSLVCAATLVVGVSAINVGAENAGSNNTAADSVEPQNSWKEYSDYCESNTSSDATQDIELFSGTDIDFAGTGDRRDFTVNVETDGLYNLEFTYLPQKGTGTDIIFSILADGKSPYSALEKIRLVRYWKNAKDELSVDKDGNELTPEQVEVGEYITALAMDDTGIIVEPYKIYLSAGQHKITLVSVSEPVKLNRFVLKAPEKTLSYSETVTDTVSDIQADVIYVQGEKANLKSTNSLVPKADTGSVSLTPQSKKGNVLNYIGSTPWQNPGDKLIWNVNVETAGYYKLAFHFKQSDVINGESIRWLKIDGKTPFEEAKTIKFNYSAKWQYKVLGDDAENPYYIWLDAGDHTLSLEVTLGYVTDYYQRLSDIVDVLSETYMQIVMITGETPDSNRDYELFNQIHGLNETLISLHSDLLALSDDMQNMTGQRSSQYSAALNNMARVLKQMYDSHYLAHQYVGNYYSNYCTVSSWLYEMKEMPIWLDEIQIIPAGTENPGVNDGFFESILFIVQRFFLSFVGDYKTEEESKNEREIEIWVNWGLDQASALSQLIQDSFTEETGISVNLKITNASLIKGLLSNNYPDLSLHLARTEPVNLGMRGALYDLTQFDDYEEVITRFTDNASTPFMYKDAAYALPDTQGFYIMFYRKDIFEKLNLKVPETWDEFIEVATVIQRNNMQIYVPYTQITTTTTVNTGLGSLNIFPTLLMQNNVSLYNKEQNACNLDSIESIKVFEFWTDLYKDYKYLKQADFYNRFRVGSMPLGIAPYNTYLTLEAAAPEIQGKWSMALVPGVVGGNNAVAGSGSGCSIINKSENKEEAWEFLKWWTSAETQLRYSNQVEAMLGLVGRVQSATVDAVKNMAWENNAGEIIAEQWSRVEELPEIPGSYYLTRAVDQAFWESMNSNKDARTILIKWSKVADQEIYRKIKEYS